MKKSIYALFYLLLSLSPLLAQSQETLELVSEKLASLEIRLTQVQDTFAQKQAEQASDSVLHKIKQDIESYKLLISEAKKKQAELVKQLDYLQKTNLNASLKSKQEEELQMQSTSLANSLISIEENLRQTEESLKENSPQPICIEEKEPICLDIFDYCYQESENGYLIEITLPEIQSPETLKNKTQAWIELANEEMEKVKESGRNWNKEKPGAPQYLYLCKYEQYYNQELDLLSLVSSFYEYIGDFPGTEKIQALMITRDLKLVKINDIFSSQQMAYIQEELNRQLKEDIARSEDDVDKKYLTGSHVDLNKATFYFSESSLEVCFPTGVLNSQLGKAACFSIPLNDILQH